ncbi:MAG: hypothetical protein EAZ42_11405 [Verrucomicrobia bacterium]|nr:MAG: hypothetical protein EAZ42_11405 [Verrucomicrobiota bacterium]
MKTTQLQLTLLTIMLGWIASSIGHAQSTIDATNKYAYGANTGWINFRHNTPTSPAGISVQGSFLTGFAYAANTGWINFGTTPTNGHTFSNTGSDFGVNQDGAGNLSGFAYSANTGWINFGWAVVSNPDRPRFDLVTGNFAGFAYSANTGWVNLGSGYLQTDTISRPDSDGDGIADAWERLHFLNLTAANASSDFDKDGSSDLSEYLADTNPKNLSDYLRVTFQSFAAAYTQTTMTFTSKPTRVYRLEHSPNLNHPWTNSSLGTFAPDGGTTTTRNFNFPSDSRRFFRACAQLPLQ